eukprot:GHVS01063421.1.p1 GENE.GHVS01063421.1~~GHVS01063421.1.p1  ORF type:complete len:350 (-),score=67.22 GHVS01063421.1:1137-2186(-)
MYADGFNETKKAGAAASPAWTVSVGEDVRWLKLISDQQLLVVGERTALLTLDTATGKILSQSYQPDLVSSACALCTYSLPAQAPPASNILMVNDTNYLFVISNHKQVAWTAKLAAASGRVVATAVGELGKTMGMIAVVTEQGDIAVVYLGTASSTGTAWASNADRRSSITGGCALALDLETEIRELHDEIEQKETDKVDQENNRCQHGLTLSEQTPSRFIRTANVITGVSRSASQDEEEEAALAAVVANVNWLERCYGVFMVKLCLNTYTEEDDVWVTSSGSYLVHPPQQQPMHWPTLSPGETHSITLIYALPPDTVDLAREVTVRANSTCSSTAAVTFRLPLQLISPT